MRIHKLGEKGQKDEYSLGVEGVGQKTLTKKVQSLPGRKARGRGCGVRLRRDADHGRARGRAAAQGLEAYPDEVGRAHILENAEPKDGLGNKGRNAQHGRRGVQAGAHGHAAGRRPAPGGGRHKGIFWQ